MLYSSARFIQLWPVLGLAFMQELVKKSWF